MITLTVFQSLVQQCAPAVAPSTMTAVVKVESGFNPYAIGVVHGRLERQPVTVGEAVATAHALDAAGWNYSAGLAQVNRSNWHRYGLTPERAFDPCLNLAAGAAILQGCFERAGGADAGTAAQRQDALRAGLSCYTSGDFSGGFRTGYVQRVIAQATPSSPVVPAIGSDAFSPIPVILSSPQAAHSDQSGDRRLVEPSRDDRTQPKLHQSDGMTQDSAVVF